MIRTLRTRSATVRPSSTADRAIGIRQAGGEVLPQHDGADEQTPHYHGRQGPLHLSANNKKGTFTLASEKPFRGLLSTFSYFPIICPHGLAMVQQDPHYLETHMDGSGPYTLVEAVHGDHITYKLRPEWKWGPPGTTTATMPKTLVYKVYGDETTAANLLLTGGLDYAQMTARNAAVAVERRRPQPRTQRAAEHGRR